MRRGIHILVLISMLPGMLVGLGPDRVLCVGTNGHMAVEPATLCSQVSCASMLSGTSEDNQPRQQPAFVRPLGCDPCADVPGASSSVSTSRDLGSSAQTQAHPVPPVTMAVFAVAEPAVADIRIRPADTPAYGCVFLRTSVLLI